MPEKDEEQRASRTLSLRVTTLSRMADVCEKKGVSLSEYADEALREKLVKDEKALGLSKPAK